MQKVEGVQTVQVSLNDGMTILDLKPDNKVTLAKLRQVIKNGGFVPKEAQIVANGNLVTGEGASVFEVSGTRERLAPIVQAQPAGDAWRITVGPVPK